MEANPYQAPEADLGLAGGSVLSEGQHEFDDMENLVIDKAGRRAHLWGIFSLLIGALCILGGGFVVVTAGVLTADQFLGQMGKSLGALVAGLALFLLVNGVVYGVMGKLYMDSGKALRAVVTTSGGDVEHLLQSLKRLSTAFQLETIMTLVALAILILGEVAGFTLDATGM